MQLTLLQFDMEDPFHGHWQLSKQGIHWPVSHDHTTGSSVELTKVTYFFEVYCWPGYEFSLDYRLKYFHNLLEQAKKLKLCF